MNLKGLGILFVISLTFLVGMMWQKTNTLSNQAGTSTRTNQIAGTTNFVRAEPTASPTATVTKKIVIATKPTQKVVEQQAGWRKIKSWSGNGITTTEQFTITSKQWRINYSLSPSHTGYAQLQVFVYTPQQDYAVESPIFTSTPGNGTSNIYRSGTFYLKILGMENWTIEVEELI